MAKRKQMEWTSFDVSFEKQPSFDVGMKYGDALLCCHPGSCDDDCEVPYIRKQLNKLTREQMKAALYECSSDYDNREMLRDELELYIVWMTAGDIVDNVYKREGLNPFPVLSGNTTECRVNY